MNPNPKSWLLTASLAAGFVTMAALGWLLAEKPRVGTPATCTSEPPSLKSPTRPPLRFNRYIIPDQAKARLQAILAIASPKERMRATIALANSLPASELENWLEGQWFDDCEGFDLTLFKTIAEERFQREFPEQFALGRHNNGSSALLNDWAKDDPQRALDFFKSYPNDKRQTNVLAAMAETHPALALARLQELITCGLDTNGGGTEIIRQLAQHDPEALEAVLDDLPTPWRKEAENAFVARKLNESFGEEIKALIALPDGWETFRKARRDVDGSDQKLFGELPKLPDSWKAALSANAYDFIDKSNAETWFGVEWEGRGFTTEQAAKIRRQAIDALSYDKPETALKLMAKAGFPDNEKHEIIWNIINFIDGEGTQKSIRLFGLLPTEQDRQFARQALEKRNTE